MLLQLKERKSTCQLIMCFKRNPIAQILAKRVKTAKFVCFLRSLAFLKFGLGFLRFRNLDTDRPKWQDPLISHVTYSVY